jgi:hypothetical protein
MTWVKLDDKFHRNEKVARISSDALRAYVFSLSYCGDTALPTGFLSQEEAQSLVRRGKVAAILEELVRLNAWERVPAGYLIHDFEEYLPKTSTERVKRFRNERRNVSEAFQKPLGNEPSRATGAPVPEPEPVPGTPGVTVTPDVVSPSHSQSTSGDIALPPDEVPLQRENGDVSDDALAVVACFAEVLGRKLSGKEQIQCQYWLDDQLKDRVYLNAQDAVTRIKERIAYWQTHGSKLPTTVRDLQLRLGEALQQQNDYVADHGGVKVDHRADGRAGGSLERVYEPEAAG